MAPRPAFVQAGAGGQSATAALFTITIPSGLTIGDMIFMHLVFKGGFGLGPTVLVNSGIESEAGTANTITNFSAARSMGASDSHCLYYGYASATSCSVSVTPPANGADTYGRLYDFSGVGRSKNNNAMPGFEMLSAIDNFHYAEGTDITIEAPDGDDAVFPIKPKGSARLAACFIGVADDNAVGPFTGGPAWTEPVAEFTSTTGSDACLALQTLALDTGDVPAAAAYTMAIADPWGTITPVLRPPASGVHVRRRNQYLRRR